MGAMFGAKSLRLLLILIIIIAGRDLAKLRCVDVELPLGVIAILYSAL